MNKQVIAALATIPGHVWTVRRGKRHRFTYCSRCGCSEKATRHFGWNRCTPDTQAGAQVVDVSDTGIEWRVCQKLIGYLCHEGGCDCRRARPPKSEENELWIEEVLASSDPSRCAVEVLLHTSSGTYGVDHFEATMLDDDIEKHIRERIRVWMQVLREIPGVRHA